MLARRLAVDVWQNGLLLAWLIRGLFQRVINTNLGGRVSRATQETAFGVPRSGPNASGSASPINIMMSSLTLLPSRDAAVIME